MKLTASRKILVPFATMLAAGAVAVGSGATFSSTSTHTVSVTSGTLHHTNNHDTSALTVKNIKPGDSLDGVLTIKNDGTLDSTLALKPTAQTSTFAAGALNLKIVETGVATPVYDGDFSGLASQTWDLGALPVGNTATLTYTVSMPTTAGDVNQGKTASAGFQYTTTQTGSNSSISWLP
ncbi:MAG: TasA family protein [Nocardioides sp.]